MSSRSFVAASSQTLRKLIMPPGARSLAGWGKTNVSGTQIIMVCTAAPFSTTFEIATVASGATNKLTGNIIDGVGASGATTSTSMVINTWFHWALTIDATNINVYVNGGGKGTAAYTETLRTWVRHEIAGPGSFFDGQIAHVAAWSSALMDAEVLALYEGRCPPMDVGVALASLQYYAPLEHDDFCIFGEGTAGSQLIFSPQNAPTFSDEDPNVYPMVGGIAAA